MRQGQTTLGMLRATSKLLILPIYHRKALPLRPGGKWSGHFGAASRFHNQIAMSEPVTAKKSIGSVDRDMMNYVHRTKLRHLQLRQTYHRIKRTNQRHIEQNSFYRRKRMRSIQTALKTFFQFEIKTKLQEQAKLVNLYGQAAVNRALGESVTSQERERRCEIVHKKVTTLPIVPAAKRHIVLQRQYHNDMFDTRLRHR